MFDDNGRLKIDFLYYLGYFELQRLKMKFVSVPCYCISFSPVYVRKQTGP